MSTLNVGQSTPENSIKVFEFAIVALLEWLGVEWSDYQTRETAELMSAEYHWMSLAEIKAFTAKVKTGHFGKEWGKLRPMILMGWMLEWSSEVLEARAGKIGTPIRETPPGQEPEGTIDISQRLGPVLAELQADLTQQREEERKEREEARQAQQSSITRHGVYVIAGRLAAGEKLTSPEEIAFHDSNRVAIDEALTLFRKSKNNR